MRICEANTRILRANFRLKTDAMFIEFLLALPRTNGSPPTREESNSAQGAGVRKTPQQRRVGCVFPMTAQAESASRNPRPDWDSFSGWRLKRKLRPGIRAQNGTRFPTGGPSGKYIPESPLKTGRAFRSISSTPKPMRPPFQNWVEEGQNAIAGGQYDCRR